MYVETKCEGEAPSCTPSMADLIAWLETQDHAGRYNFLDYHGACLIGQYLAARGMPTTVLDYIHIDGLYMRVCRAIFGGDGTYVTPACALPWTFGTALERCRSRQSAAR
jgi:hypothetical protein